MRYGTRDFWPWIPLFLAGMLTMAGFVSGCGTGGGGGGQPAGNVIIEGPTANEGEAGAPGVGSLEAGTSDPSGGGQGLAPVKLE